MELIALVAVSFLSGFLSGTIGFASGVLPAALLSLVIPSATAVPLLAPIVLAGAAVALAFHWNEWKMRHVLLVLPPLLLGTWWGTEFLTSAPARLVNYAIAFFVIVVALQELGGRFAAQDGKRFGLRRAVGSGAGGLLVGLVSGVASTIAHAGGVVVSAYLVSAGLKREAFTGTVLLILVLADTAKLLAFLQAGLITEEMIGPIAWSVPFLLLGVYSGRHVYRRLSNRRFRTVVAATLLGLGIFLLGGP